MPWKRTIITTLLAGIGLLLMTGLAPVAEADSHVGDSRAARSEANPNSNTTTTAKPSVSASASASADPAPAGWRYDTYYIFPLTRHMPDSNLALGLKIALYPVAVAIDLIQWPLGAIAGLAGE